MIKNKLENKKPEKNKEQKTSAQAAMRAYS